MNKTKLIMTGKCYSDKLISEKPIKNNSNIFYVYICGWKMAQNFTPHLDLFLATEPNSCPTNTSFKLSVSSL